MVDISGDGLVDNPTRADPFTVKDSLKFLYFSKVYTLEFQPDSSDNLIIVDESIA